MLRKIVFFFVTLAYLIPAYAGFYLGASVGPEGADFRQRAHASRIGTFDVIDINHFAGAGVFGSLFGGYGWQHNRYYLGGEINGNLSSVEYRLSNDEYLHHNFQKTTFRVNHSVGLSLLPGYFLSESTLFFGRLGYANGRVKISDSDPTILSQNKNKNGIRYGLGLQHRLTPSLKLILDYSQISYGGITSTVYEPMGMVLKRTKITPTTAQMGLGLIYSFDPPPSPMYVK